ncbi:uncharacterized protein LOC111043315 [Nilaparvata lugens]|uniref:uncharacterized protein LOC111043315 n=1 Tax=Nilaparvata lugens TaxID=108931 RepID=UPI00193E4627|nr:uncharacterized protein LOC111043315 [Nilaparvata lugens]
MSKDITFSDWSEKLDSGTNHWLPAYGFQQPIQLQEAFLQQHERNLDLINNDTVSQQQAYLFLETILEETSDDLRSESDYSGPAGWPDTDSETESVIHVAPLGAAACAEWAGSERDLAVPKKRRRRQLNNDPGVHDEDDDDLLHPPHDVLSSRSSSLLQFETLERHCEDIFKTEQRSSPSVHSNLSFDSLEKDRWRYRSGSQDSLEDEASSMTSSCESSSEVSSSDDEALNRSFSSRSGSSSFRSSTGLRSYHSFDSLNLYQQYDKPEGSLLSGEFSQSLNNNSLPAEETHEAAPTCTARGMYKTVECLTEIPVHGCGRQTITSTCKTEDSLVKNEDKTPAKGTQRSSENLSEDSGFGEHIPRGSSNNLSARSVKVYPIAEDEYDTCDSYYADISRESKDVTGCHRKEEESMREQEVVGVIEEEDEDDEGEDGMIIRRVGEDDKREWKKSSSNGRCDAVAKFSDSGVWQSAPDLLSAQCRPQLYGAPFVSTSALVVNFVQRGVRDDDEPSLVEHESKPLLSPSPSPQVLASDLPNMASRLPVVSTPDLFLATHDLLEIEKRNTLLKNFRNSTVSLSGDALLESERSSGPPTHNKKTGSEGRLSRNSKGGSRGSNIMITTSFVNLTPGGSTKGVHFCPVVSEVSWRDTSEDSCSSQDEAETESDHVTSAIKRFSACGGGKYGTSGSSVSVAVQTAMEPLNRHSPSANDNHSASKLPPISASSNNASSQVPKQKPGRFGGFFQRFSLRRLSGKKAKDKRRPPLVSTSVSTQPPPTTTPDSDQVQIIPLHPPPPPSPPPHTTSVAASKPPLPRRRDSPVGGGSPGLSSAMTTAAARNHRGLLETDLDSDLTKKTRSLLNLEDGMKPSPSHHLPPRDELTRDAETRAKSMEFLLDKDNQAAIKPPENELQKVGGADRVMSEHQLRVQRSLQRLNVPDWYKNSTLPQQGFLLKKRHSDAASTLGGWQGLGSKTTSLSSLGSSQSAVPRSPTGGEVVSPSPTPHVGFTRWSTSRLNSAATSTSTSPCGSARSSFNCRQPYLGWRSQERLTRPPRTPAERLAAGILPQKPSAQNTPNLNEVRTSIKEVTSAIVHYVSGTGSRTATGDSNDRLSPALGRHWDRDNSSSRSASPRGSTGRLCWLESSFVGSRPLEVPETPLGPPTASNCTNKGHDLYLDLSTNSQLQRPHLNGELLLSSLWHLKKVTNNIFGDMGDQADEDSLLDYHSSTLGRTRPSPSSTTMDDVLDSLLGLPSTSRSPSPSPAPTTRRSCGDLRTRSDLPESASHGPNPCEKTTRRGSEGGSESRLHVIRGGRRVSFDVEGGEEGQVKCRFAKCGKTASVADAKNTFKTCHNCAHVYCSRECRRAHWEKHRKTCLHSRVGALCRRVLSSIKDDSETLHHVSVLARRGFLARGRGAVKCFFSSPEQAEKFVTHGLTDLGEPTFVRWADLLPGEMGPELYSELLKLCKAYNPDTRFVIYVAVCVISEVPTTGAVKWERQLVSRCTKFKLSRPLLAPAKQQSAQNISRDSDDPETLILTSLPGCQEQAIQRARQVSFTNIQRHLRQRGVSLRRHFPEVYQRLCAYVEGSSERFTPVTIYPRDSATGKSFMCIIMPDAEPEKLQLLPTDSTRVQTIDISLEPQPQAN